jgi:hypothetical protein
MHWSESFVQFLRRVAPEVTDVPLYLLKASEDGTKWFPEWMAAFSPLADLQAQTVLERLGQWCGRGICIRVREDFEAWSPRLKAGTLLHEMAHAIEFLSEPNALCPVANLSPIAREMLDGCESELLAEVGISRSELMKAQHGAEFVRLCCHLHWRARTEIPLSPADLQFLHKVYSLDSERYEDVLNALAGELAMSRNLNLRRLRQAPESFTELFR